MGVKQGNVIYLKFLFYAGVELIYSVVLVSGVQQSDPVVHIHTVILLQILFPCSLLQNTKQSFLCYIVNPA